MSIGRDHEIVILGGGPAGAAAACRVARAGCAPLVIERDPEPRHKVCGEFLSVEAQAYLVDLGIDPQALGAARIMVLRVVEGGRIAEAPLPFAGLGLTRRALDEALLRRAEEQGASVMRGISVRDATAEGAMLRVGLRDAPGIRARTVFLATGKHDLRWPRRPSATGAHDPIGFKTYFVLAPSQRAALGGAIEILFFAGGYAGLQHVEAGLTNLCLVVRRSVFDTVGKSWDALLAHLCRASPHLAERLAGAKPHLEKPLSVFGIPYGFIHQGGAADPEGLFRLGDQAGVIPSFSGDGIAIALHTGGLAAATYLAQGNAAAAFHSRVRQDIRRQIRLAGILERVSRMRIARPALLRACRACPGILGTLAAWTRIPGAALARTGIGRPS
jgi:flavin-dependent dehydrogenase